MSFLDNDDGVQENVLEEYQSQLDRAPVEAGKTKYFHDNLAETHELIPLRHYLDVEKQSLHKVLQMIVKLLKSGKNVCIDDCNSAERTRASIIQTLTKEIPPLSVKSVLFAPAGGVLQVHWACEWASAYWQLKEFYHDQPSSSSPPFPESDLGNLFNAGEPYKTPNEFRLKEFEKYAQPVHPNAEGFTSVDYVAPQLYSLCAPFHRAALLIDISSVFYFQHMANENYFIESHFPAEAIRASLDEWIRTNSGPDKDKDPRVIFLVDERLLFPVVLEVDAANPAAQSERIASFLAEFKKALINLKLHHPLYFICAQYGAFDEESFFSLPHSGMIAWAQHRHRLNLQACYYITSKPKVSSTGVVTENVIPSGLPHYLSSDNFFEQTGWDMKSKLHKHAIEVPQIPPFLKSINFLGLLPEPNPPLQYGLSESRADYLICEEHAGFGRLHGCVVPPPSAAAVAAAAANASITSPPAGERRRSRKLPQFMKSEEGKSRQLPDWMSAPSAAPAATKVKAEPSESSPPAAKRRKVSEDSIEDSSVDHARVQQQTAPPRQAAIKPDPFPLEMQRVSVAPPFPPPAPTPSNRNAPGRHESSIRSRPERRMIDDHLFDSNSTDDWVDTRSEQTVNLVAANSMAPGADVVQPEEDEIEIEAEPGPGADDAEAEADAQPQDVAESSPLAAITQSFADDDDDDDIFAQVNDAEQQAKKSQSLVFKSQKQ